MDTLTSGFLKLRPATLQDKLSVYVWLAKSNLTSEMLGPPNYPDAETPSWEEFNQDYTDHYFDGSNPLQGQCFILIFKNQEIGQINHNAIDCENGTVEIDIWLADKMFTGKGLGTESIRLLCDYLHRSFACRKVYIAPSARNIHAIKAYTKAGFIRVNQMPQHFKPDYHDAVLMEKYI